jgi:signal transduction histidine kinase
VAPTASFAPTATDRRLVARRVHLGFWLGLAPLGAYAIADLWWYRDAAHLLLPIKALALAAVLACAAGLRSAFGRRHPSRIGLLGFAPLCAASVGSGVIVGEIMPSAVLIATLCLGTGAMLPWGLLPQLALTLFGAACLAVGSVVVTGDLFPASGAAIAFAFGLAMSVITARETGRYRAERARVEGALLTKSGELHAINQAMTRYLEQGELADASAILLRAALEQTGSTCGLAALVTEGPRLRLVATAGLEAAGEATGAESAGVGRGGSPRLLPIVEPGSALGASLVNGSEIVEERLLAVPVQRGAEVVGVLALANRPGGYSARDPVGLQALCRTAGVIYDSYRHQEARRTDREITSALARVGRELLSSVDAPELLERLCQVTTEALGCDASHTLLYRAEERVFTPVAGHGDSPEDWESLKLLRLPADVFANLVARFDHVEVQEIDRRREASGPWAGMLASDPGMARMLWVALRRGGEIIGLHTAVFRSEARDIGQREQRIFEGIGRLASLALRNALLVEELERANRVRSEFVATMSHELRTPLNVAIGYCDMLHEGALGDLTTEQGHAVRRIQRSVDELRELVESTLDLSRLDAGRVDVEASDVGLEELFEELRGDVEGLARPGVELEWTAVPALQLSTDRMKVKILVKNLVRNALKFTHRGRVEVSAGRASAGGVELRVRDTGIGIGPESRDLIFEPFRRAVDEDLYGGVGLGLHIVRRLVETLGGAIEVESEVGRGSTFTVRLPPVSPR